AAAVPRVIASAVADRDVEIAVLAALDVPRVVVARGRRHVIDQHGLGRQADRVVVREDEAGDPVDRRAGRAARPGRLVERVEEVDEPVLPGPGAEARVDRYA